MLKSLTTQRKPVSVAGVPVKNADRKKANRLENLSDFAESKDWELFVFKHAETDYTCFYQKDTYDLSLKNKITYYVFEPFTDAPVLKGSIEMGKSWRDGFWATVEAAIQKDFASSVVLPFKKGSIVCCQWAGSYVDFYRVLKCSASRVTLQPLENLPVMAMRIKDPGGFGSENARTVMPSRNPDPKGKIITRSFYDFRGEYHVKITKHQIGVPWDGEPKWEDYYQA